MKASELRIGNIINRQGKRITVNGADIKWQEDGSYAGCEGIPLTEEWIFSLGFEKVQYLNCFSIGAPPFDFKIEFLPKENFILFFSGNVTTGHAPCEFVHQLQNLYFTLTGEELTIKEPIPIL